MPKNQIYTTQDYVHLFQKGEEQGFDHFFHQYYPALCFFASTIIKETFVSEEIAAEAFIKIWKHHQKFDNEKLIKAYLYQIVKNDCLKWLHKNTKFAAAANEYLVFTEQNQPSLIEAIIRAEVYRHLHLSIQQLPASCRQIFELLFIEGRSINETAEELNLTPSTVRSQKARGIEILRKKIAL